MARSTQSKRVSWPTDVNLCQVRLFLSEDAPSQAGLGAQDHLQAKAAWLLHAAGLSGSDDSLPPGFESPNKYNPKIDALQIPLIKWQCPSRLVLNPEWLVVAGEESIEVSSENQRQSGVLEAIYPRSSSIPPNPFFPPDVQASRSDDSGTPLIPITAIEDEDGTEQLDATKPQNQDTLMHPNHAPIRSCNSPNAEALHKSIPDRAFNNSEKLQSQSNGVPSTPNPPLPQQPPSASRMPISLSALTAEPDVLAAASAAFTAIVKSSEEGSLIDQDLLIKILSDPLMVGKLLSEYSAPKPPPPPPPLQQPSQPPPQSSRPPPPHVSFSGPISAAPPASRIFQVQNHAPALASNHHPPVLHMPIVNPVRAPAPPVKDANYYKSLIQLHGGDKPEAQDQNPMQSSSIGNLNQRDLKAKVQKPCAYFNTPRGCRHGAGCLFLHDASSMPQRIEQPTGTTAKKIKLDGGIAGRN